MSRLFDVPDRWKSCVEKILLGQVDKISFHAANYAVIEAVALEFKNDDAVMHFTDGFLETVYKKLIDPARTYGYYFGNMPKAERQQIFRTSSECQYGGSSERVRAACVTILSAIDAERFRRERLSSNARQA